MRAPASSLALLVLAALLGAVPARAQWTADPSLNLPVCTLDGIQSPAAVVGDGAGGAYVVWQDGRAAAPGIYAQRLDRDGYAQWATDGLAVATTPPGNAPVACGDGAGGLVVAWTEVSGAVLHLRAQRFAPDGAPLWTAGGVDVSDPPVSVTTPATLTPDGAGGVVVTWLDADVHPGSTSVRIQRLDADGQRLWSGGDVILGGKSDFSSTQQVAPDGTGGVIVAWVDHRWVYPDLYAQRVDGSGSLPWGSADLLVCPFLADLRYWPCIAQDAAGGAVISWIENRPGANIFAQRVSATGLRQWDANGVLVSGSESVYDDTLLADGHGGAFVSWRGGKGVRVQHVGGDASLAWGPGGVPAALSPVRGGYPHPLAPGSDGGVIVTWAPYNGTSYEVRAQAVDSTGAARWGASGTAVCTAGGSHYWPLLDSDGSGGAIIAWNDFRSGTSWDLYAQHVTATGTLAVPPDGKPAALALAAGPVPALRGTGVGMRFALPDAGRARLVVHDVAGRLVRVVASGAFAAGPHVARWDGRDEAGRAAAPGLYFARLEAARGTARARIVVTD